MKQILVWSIGFFMALSSPILAHAEILYVSFDSSSATSTGLGPNTGNNPKYRIVGSFVAAHDIDFNNATSSIVFEGTNFTGGVNFNIDFSTTTDSLYPDTNLGTFKSFWPKSITALNDGLAHQYIASWGPGGLGPNDAIVHTGETVYVLIYSTQGFPFAAQSVTTDTPGTSFFGEITYNEPPHFLDPATHILTVTPQGGTTIATSSAAVVGTKVNINAREYTDALAANNGKWFVQMVIKPASVVTGIPSAAGAFDAAFGITTINFPITTSGTLTFSTTTSITTKGQYIMTTQIIRPPAYGSFLAWFGIGSATVLDATSTTFIADHMTGVNILQASTTDFISQFMASTSDQLIASCASFTGFNLGDCLNLLFIPQSGDLTRVMNDLNNGLFQFAPFGYFTRVVAIFNGQATSSFPLLTTSFPNPSNPSEEMTYTFDQNEALAGAGTLLDNLTIPQDPSINVRESMDLIVKTIIALSVMSYIFYDLAHSRRGATHVRTKLS